MRRIKKWYEHQLEGEVDTIIKCNHVVKARKSDIVVVEKESKRRIIIIVDILLHHGIRKVLQKKYQDLKREIGKL